MKRLLKTVLENLGYKVQGIRYTPRHLLEPSMVRVLEFDDIICRYMVEHRQNLTFIQVGAFDGVTKDPLTSIEVTEETLSTSDCVVLVTNHSDFDYNFLQQHSQLILID